MQSRRGRLMTGEHEATAAVMPREARRSAAGADAQHEGYRRQLEQTTTHRDDYGLVCFSNSGYHIAGGLTSISLENAKRLTVGSESACVLDDNGVSCFKIR